MPAEGLYLAITTLAFSFIINHVILYAEIVTHGPNGIFVTGARIFGFDVQKGPPPYYLALGLTIATILAALNGPIHELSDQALVSVHMLQHLLLTLVMPPLLLAGTPGWLLRPLLGTPGVAPTGRQLPRPLVALALYSVVFAAWHLPGPYEWALRHHGVHIVEHLLFMATAVPVAPVVPVAR